MQRLASNLSQSPIAKVAVIAFLILIMLIPMTMTRSVIDDRRAVGDEALRDIMRSWGGRQVIGAPILAVPYLGVRVDPYGDRHEKSGHVYLLSEEFSVEAEVVPEIRYRGLHKVPVYTANTTMIGVFSTPDVSGLGIDNATFDWSRAYFALPVADARAIRDLPSMQIGENQIEFEAGGTKVPGFPPQIVAPAGSLLDEDGRSAPLSFSIDLDFGGTDQLRYLPLGDSTTVSMRSDWQSPSFGGAYLPENREITDQGFTATWRVSSLGRALPSRWVDVAYDYATIQNTSFGVDLFMPIGPYQLTDRATKYAVLFIGLTFVAYFLFEVLGRLRLHPLQYLLVGLANTLFYLLLLSFAEHIGFGWSYFVSTIASTGLVSAYSASILRGWKRAVFITVMLFCLYGFLYLTLNAESYAMIAGSIGLWVTLSVVMYLTRDIDWYRWGSSAEAIEIGTTSDAEKNS